MELITYDVVVDNVGYVLTDEPSYDIAKSIYDDYVAMGYEQVSLWASDESDPIEVYEVPGYEELYDMNMAIEQEGE
jgi:hypothetical protein